MIFISFILTTPGVRLTKNRDFVLFKPQRNEMLSQSCWGPKPDRRFRTTAAETPVKAITNLTTSRFDKI